MKAGFTENQLEEAIERVLAGEKLAAVAGSSTVSLATQKRKVAARKEAVQLGRQQPGPAPLLPPECEADLATWIAAMQRHVMPIQPWEVLEAANENHHMIYGNLRSTKDLTTDQYNLGGRAKSWAYTREATSPGCFATWAQLCEQLRAAFLLANYEYRQRSRFLACKQGKREVHEYSQEMRVLTASLVGTPLPEHIKVTVFMDGLRVGPARTHLFRVQASTMEEAIQGALQEECSHKQARTPAAAWNAGSFPNTAVSGGFNSGPMPMDLSLAEQSDIR